VQNEKASFLRALLPVLDNLQLAIDAAERSSPVEGLLEGLRGTRSGFEAALATVGVENVPGEGSNFDPELHEAVDIKETDAAQDGKVTVVYSRGYRIGNRLLRPARVQVGRANQ
jgi:molecular chaperone GrpE